MLKVNVDVPEQVKVIPERVLLSPFMLTTPVEYAEVDNTTQVRVFQPPSTHEAVDRSVAEIVPPAIVLRSPESDTMTRALFDDVMMRPPAELFELPILIMMVELADAVTVTPANTFQSPEI